MTNWAIWSGQKRCGRTILSIVISSGFAVMALAATSLNAQTITSISPNSIKLGGAATNVTVYGTGFAASQPISIACQPTSAYPLQSSGGKTYVTVPIPSSMLLNESEISITTTACPTGRPAGAKTIAVVAMKDVAPLGQAVLGVDVSAASSASPQAVVLALAVVDVPLKTSAHLWRDNNFLWLSGQLGLKGMAQPGAISGAASAGYYASAANATPDKIVQSLDASAHFGYQFRRWKIPIETFDVEDTTGNSTDGSETLGTFSVIAGGGAVTPLSVSQASPQVFEATPLVLQSTVPVAPTSSFASSCGANPAATPTCFVIFTPADRTHFYRYYDIGFRLKLYGEDKQDNELRFPAIVDLTIGQNEYVTGGRFDGAVLHLGATLPVPRIDSAFFFGSLDMGLSQSNGGGAQLQLIPAPVTTGLTATSPSVYTILTSQPNRDRYQLGFGIDVFHLLSSYLDKQKATK
jgi:hypothetical protein